MSFNDIFQNPSRDFQLYELLFGSTIILGMYSLFEINEAVIRMVLNFHYIDTVDGWKSGFEVSKFPIGIMHHRWLLALSSDSQLANTFRYRGLLI